MVGLDIDHRRLPSDIRHPTSDIRHLTSDIRRFGTAILEAVAPHCVAAKINTAFYERLGWRGWRVMEELAQEAQKQELLVILDGKRGDIASTASAYAGLLDGPYDALTLHPYMGPDSLEPFLPACREGGRGIFVVVRSTNPGAGELQEARVVDRGSLNLQADAGFGESHYSRVCDVVSDWVLEMGRDLVGELGYSPVGAVVGVSSAETARELRERLPGVPFLVPGFGAQGATAEDVAVCFDEKGLGAVVNASRSILYAFEKDPAQDFASAAARAAESAKAEINRADR